VTNPANNSASFLHARRLCAAQTIAIASLFIISLTSLLGALTNGSQVTALPTAYHYAHLPEANPYRVVLERWESLPTETVSQILAWVNAEPAASRPTPPAELEVEIVAIAQGLQSAAQTGAARADLWPVKYDEAQPDNPLAVTIPEVGSLRNLAQVAVKYADSLPPNEAIPLYAAAQQAGQDVTHGPTFIRGLTGIAMQGLASAGPMRRLAEFRPAELDQLETAFSQLRSANSPLESCQGERDLFFVPILERILLPGLIAAQAMHDAPANTEAISGKALDARLSEYRLSGLIDDGEQRVVIEKQNTGQSFSITPGQVVEGLELVSIDFAARRAWLRLDGEPVMLDLESKRLSSARQSYARLKELFTSLSLYDRDNSIGDEILKLARQHPDGPEGYVIDLLAQYDERMAAQLASVNQASMPNNPSLPIDTDPLIELLMPTFTVVLRIHQQSELTTPMLLAAIRHRQGRAAEAPADPWGGQTNDTTAPPPFTYETTPDGGFILRSAYERSPGAPVAYKFAAPDAGIVRASTP
jgi:hypothetical protein